VSHTELLPLRRETAGGGFIILYSYAPTLALHLIGVLTAAPLASQTPYGVTSKPAELLAAYVREHEALDRRYRAGLQLTHILGNHSAYSAADVETLLRGLEELALTGPSVSHLRAESVLKLALPGSNRVADPRADTYSRLVRIYLASQDGLVRMMVVRAMGFLAVRSRAAAFLEGVAARYPKHYVTEPGAAVTSLLMLSDEGRAVLKRLHETGAVQQAETRHRLKVLAGRGYR
jgi:hypothetical protein